MNVEFEVVEYDSPEAVNHRARIKEQEGGQPFPPDYESTVERVPR